MSVFSMETLKNLDLSGVGLSLNIALLKAFHRKEKNSNILILSIILFEDENGSISLALKEARKLLASQYIIERNVFFK